VSEAAAEVATSCAPVVAYDGRKYSLYLEYATCVRPSIVRDLVATGGHSPYMYRARSIEGVPVESAIAVAAGHDERVRVVCEWDFYPSDDLSPDEARRIAADATIAIDETPTKAAVVRLPSGDQEPSSGQMAHLLALRG
jgi:hypothetical protein